jgi:hypothetical protein
MVGDTALWTEISSSFKMNCGARWGKRMAKPSQLTEVQLKISFRRVLRYVVTYVRR